MLYFTESGIRKRVEVTKKEGKTERTKGINIEWLCGWFRTAEKVGGG